MEHRGTAIRIEVKSPEDRVLCDKVVEEARDNAIKELKEAGSFVLIVTNTEGEVGSAISSVRSLVVPQVVVSMGRIIRQLSDETFKAGNPMIIMSLLRAMDEATKEMRKESECGCEQCQIQREEEKDES